MKYKLITTDDFIAQELPRLGIAMLGSSLYYERRSKESFTLSEAQKIRDRLIKENPFFSRIGIYYSE